MKILLVDDDPGIAEIASLALMRVGGFDVVTTDQADEALAIVTQGGIDCAILDVMMPRVDGPTLFRRLRELPEAHDLPVIFLTAKVQNHEVEKLLELGASGVISKPFDPMQLSNQVRDILHVLAT
jgi:DNA-binding response OmpR family regulator